MPGAHGPAPARMAVVHPLVIDVDDPRRADISALLQRHLDFAHETSPPEDVHALDLTGLLDPSITFFSAR